MKNYIAKAKELYDAKDANGLQALLNEANSDRALPPFEYWSVSDRIEQMLRDLAR